MHEPEPRAFVVASAGLADIGAYAADTLSSLGFSAGFLKAADTLIPHLAPGRFYLFGADAGENLSSGDYKELFRSLQGVNFAGRYGALFSRAGDDAFSGLKAMLRDSDLTILEPGFLAGDSDWKKNITPWLKGLAEELRQREGR